MIVKIVNLKLSKNSEHLEKKLINPALIEDFKGFPTEFPA